MNDWLMLVGSFVPLFLLLVIVWAVDRHMKRRADHKAWERYFADEEIRRSRR